MITDLWLVRHGESEGNVAASAAERAGQDTIALTERDADVALSAVGIGQAEALGRWVGAHPELAVAWTSPYRRARDTLSIALASSTAVAPSTLPTRVDERLRDRELGILDLVTWRGVERRFPEEAARRRHLGKYYHRPPGGESWADVRLRLRSFLGDALRGEDGDHPERTTSALVIAHDAVVTLVVSLLLDFDEEETMSFAAANTVLNASVTHIVRAASTDGWGARWQLRAFSDASHLAEAGAPVTVHPGSPDDVPE